MTQDVLFVWIPKAAGNSIVHALEEHGCVYYRLKQEPWVWEFKEQGVATFGHVSVTSLMNNRAFSDAFLRRAYVFAFVRNPWDRLVSIASYYASGLRPRKKPQFTTDIGYNLNRLCSRLRTGRVHPLGYFDSSGLSSSNPQSVWLDEVLQHTNLSRVGRYESLDDDWRAVCTDLGWKESRLPVINASKHKHYRTYYTDETREIVAKYYREDIRRFGYSF